MMTWPPDSSIIGLVLANCCSGSTIIFGNPIMAEVEDYEFISNVKMLSDNGTLARVLEMVEEDYVVLWKSAKPEHLQLREDSYRMIRAIKALKDKIQSLSTDEKVRQFNMRRVLRSNP
jgi:hypothetical protein